jgi:hypothetical protein
MSRTKGLQSGRERRVDSDLFAPEIVISENNIPSEAPDASLDATPHIQGVDGQNDDNIDSSDNSDNQNGLQTNYNKGIKD